MVKCLIHAEQPLQIYESKAQETELKKSGYIVAEIDMLHGDVSDQIQVALGAKPKKKKAPTKEYETKVMEPESKTTGKESSKK